MGHEQKKVFRIDQGRKCCFVNFVSPTFKNVAPHLADIVHKRYGTADGAAQFMPKCSSPAKDTYLNALKSTLTLTLNLPLTLNV